MAAEEHRETGTGWPASATSSPSAGGAPGAGDPSSDVPGDPSSDVPVDPSSDMPGEAGARDAGGAAARRFSAAGAMIGLLLALLGFALVVQLQSHGNDADLAGTRQEDLVRVLSDLESQQDRLRAEISDLEESRRQLASGALGRDAALTEARRRADALGILAGTLPAAGPGLEITFSGGSDKVRPETIVDAVQELRGAGAEAMQISGANGATVRIVASTYFVGAGGNLDVSGEQLTGPYTILVIGEPRTMNTALNIPGGVVDATRQHGGTVSVRERGDVRVTALHSAPGLRFARPVQ